jgi:hypothetical protein
MDHVKTQLKLFNGIPTRYALDNILQARTAFLPATHPVFSPQDYHDLDHKTALEVLLLFSQSPAVLDPKCTTLSWVARTGVAHHQYSDEEFLTLNQYQLSDGSPLLGDFAYHPFYYHLTDQRSPPCDSLNITLNRYPYSLAITDTISPLSTTALVEHYAPRFFSALHTDHFFDLYHDLVKSRRFNPALLPFALPYDVFHQSFLSKHPNPNNHSLTLFKQMRSPPFANSYRILEETKDKLSNIDSQSWKAYLKLTSFNRQLINQIDQLPLRRHRCVVQGRRTLPRPRTRPIQRSRTLRSSRLLPSIPQRLP